jgi:hypothetical protein
VEAARGVRRKMLLGKLKKLPQEKLLLGNFRRKMKFHSNRLRDFGTISD